MMTRPSRLASILIAALVWAGAASASEISTRHPVAHAIAHAIAMHGSPKYGPDFTHFDYTDPRALKGGEVRLSAVGTFDNLNPFILKGVAAAGIASTFDTLLASSEDEPFTKYGLVAKTVEIPADRSWVIFTLRPEARFHDNTPITADDVVATFEMIRAKGHPFYRAYYASVAKAEKLGRLKIKFVFSGGENRELPLIIGEMPILSKAYYAKTDFTRTTLEAPLGSGPYRVAAVDPGRSITYERVADYWGARLAVNVGRHNMGRIRYDYYRDTTVALEALKAGEYDFRLENIAKAWATGYDSPALRQGLLKQELIRHRIPTGMQGFFFNIRRDIFADRRVRAALAYAFDFAWTNRTLFFGAYARTRSYFSNSELAATGLPGAAEVKILAPYRGRVPDEVFTTEYTPPSTAKPNSLRKNLRAAIKLLDAAGWTVRDRKLVNAATGKAMRFEILLINPSFERVALPFARNLKRLGIDVRVRTVDTAQYRNRLDGFDFDMVVASFGQSLSPGNEQRDFWGADKADIRGSRNLAGIKDPVIDELIGLVIAAPDRKSLVARTKALDRVLLWGHYAIPQWHLQAFRVAYWDKFDRPKTAPKYSLGFDTWWVDPVKEAALTRRKGDGNDR